MDPKKLDVCGSTSLDHVRFARRRQEISLFLNTIYILYLCPIFTFYIYVPYLHLIIINNYVPFMSRKDFGYNIYPGMLHAF